MRTLTVCVGPATNYCHKNVESGLLLSKIGPVHWNERDLAFLMCTGYGEWRDTHWHGEHLTGFWWEGLPRGPFRSREKGSSSCSVNFRIGYLRNRCEEAFNKATCMPRNTEVGGQMWFKRQENENCWSFDVKGKVECMGPRRFRQQRNFGMQSNALANVLCGYALSHTTDGRTCRSSSMASFPVNAPSAASSSGDCRIWTSSWDPSLRTSRKTLGAAASRSKR